MNLVFLLFPKGADLCQKYKLTCRPNTAGCDGYDDSLDASSYTEYAHGAFRLFHANVQPTFYFVNGRNKISRTITVEDAFHNNSTALLNTEYNDCLRGMIWQSIRLNKYGYVDDVSKISL